MGKLDHNHERAQTIPHNEHKHQNDDHTQQVVKVAYALDIPEPVMDKEPSPECPFCAVNYTTYHILWHSKETETKRLQMDITKEIWKGRKQEMEKLIKYVKETKIFLMK
jgi:hypothetical protein